MERMGWKKNYDDGARKDGFMNKLMKKIGSIFLFKSSMHTHKKNIEIHKIWYTFRIYCSFNAVPHDMKLASTKKFKSLFFF